MRSRCSWASRAAHARTSCRSCRFAPPAGAKARRSPARPVSRRLARAALGKLKPTEREAVVLHLVGGLDAAQVAEACGVDLATARARIARGVSQLVQEEKTTMSNTTCLRFEEDIVGLLEGTASESLKEHVATCDFCRDARHELENVARLVARAGDDVEYTPALAERLAAAVVEAAASRISETRIRESNEAAARAAAAAPSASASASASAAGPPHAALSVADSVVVSPVASRSSSSSASPSPSPSASASASRTKPPSKKAVWLLLAACASVGHQHGRGLQARRPSALARARRNACLARQGREDRAQRRRRDRRSLASRRPPARPTLGDGAEIKAGMRLVDRRPHARAHRGSTTAASSCSIARPS